MYMDMKMQIIHMVNFKINIQMKVMVSRRYLTIYLYNRNKYIMYVF